MKKTAQRLSANLPPVELYIDDVEKLVEILEPVTGPLMLRLPGYELDSPNELRELAGVLQVKKISELELTPKRLGMSGLDLSKVGARLTLTEDGTQYRGVEAQVRDLMRRRRKLLTPLRLFVLLSLSALAVWVLTEELPLRGLVVITALVLANVLLFKNFPAHCVVHLARRSERPSFLERNGDRIIVGILSATAAALITAVVSRLF